MWLQALVQPVYGLPPAQVCAIVDYLRSAARVGCAMGTADGVATVVDYPLFHSTFSTPREAGATGDAPIDPAAVDVTFSAYCLGHVTRACQSDLPARPPSLTTHTSSVSVAPPGRDTLPPDTVGDKTRPGAVAEVGSLVLVGGGSALLVDGTVQCTPTSPSLGLCTVSVCGLTASRGRWVFEVHVQQPGSFVVGWATQSCIFDSGRHIGVGDADGSWGMRAAKDGDASDGVMVCHARDVVSCLLDAHSATFATYINGRVHSQARLDGIQAGASLSPVVTVVGATSLTVVVGKVRPLAFPPPAPWQPAQRLVLALLEEEAVMAAGDKLGKLHVASGGNHLVVNDGGRIEPIGGFPSVTLEGVLLTSGRWYYEVEVLVYGCSQIGWVDVDFRPDSEYGSGVGDDKHSWAVDLHRLNVWHVDGKRFGRHYRPGDVVGVACDMDARTLMFSLKGNWQPPFGLAYSNIVYTRGLCPGVTVSYNQRCVLKVNFGERPFRHQPPDASYQPITSWVAAHMPGAGVGSTGAGAGAGAGAGTNDGRDVAPGDVAGIPSVLAAAPREQLVVTSGHNHCTVEDSMFGGAGSRLVSVVAGAACVNTGRWYYEVEVVKKGHIAVGWASPAFQGDYTQWLGVGSDSNSVGGVLLTGASGRTVVPPTSDEALRGRAAMQKLEEHWVAPCMGGEVIRVCGEAGGCMAVGMLRFSALGATTDWTVLPGAEPALSGMRPAVSFSGEFAGRLRLGDQLLHGPPSLLGDDVSAALRQAFPGEGSFSVFGLGQ